MAVAGAFWNSDRAFYVCPEATELDILLNNQIVAIPILMSWGNFFF